MRKIIKKTRLWVTFSLLVCIIHSIPSSLCDSFFHGSSYGVGIDEQHEICLNYLDEKENDEHCLHECVVFNHSKLIVYSDNLEKSVFKPYLESTYLNFPIHSSKKNIYSNFLAKRKPKPFSRKVLCKYLL